jgi:hypothetical protein
VKFQDKIIGNLQMLETAIGKRCNINNKIFIAINLRIFFETQIVNRFVIV